MRSRPADDDAALAAAPRVESSDEGSVLAIRVAPNLHAVHLVSLHGIRLRSVPAGRAKISLGLRVAYTYRDPVDDTSWCVFHRRSPRCSEFPSSWDLATTGYLDPVRHRDPDDPTQLDVADAARDRIARELRLPPALLPQPDHVEFFGVTRDARAGTTSLCGECHGLNLDPPRNSVN